MAAKKTVPKQSPVLAFGDYDLEIEHAIDEIRRAKATRVLLQLPDGLKPSAQQIREVLKREFPSIELLFWAGSCFGACDVPLHVRALKVDLILQFGHAPWRH